MNAVKKENPPLSGHSEQGAMPGQSPSINNINQSITHHHKNFNRAEKFDITLLKNVKGSGRQFTALCPAHDDRQRSLSVKIANDKVLLRCFAGCSTESIVSALGLSMSSLFADNVDATVKRSRQKTKPLQTHTIIYDYRNPDGSLAYRKKRFEFSDGSKTFAFYDTKGNKGVSGIQRVPYNLPAVLAAETVYFCEGEKAVHAIINAGHVATSLDAGANSKWIPEYTAYFEGKNIVILPDNDNAGMNYAKKIAVHLPGSQIIKLPGLPEKGDIYDWLEGGRTIEEIDGLPSEAWDAEELSDNIQTYVKGFNPINPFEVKSGKNLYEWNDIGIGNIFADAYKDISRYVPEADMWYVYDGRVWKPDVGGVAVAEQAKYIIEYLLDCRKLIDDDDRRNTWVEFIIKRAKSHARDIMLKDARSVYPVNIAEFDKNPYLFNCQNCTIDLQTFTQHKHRPEDYLSKVSNVTIDPDARCERWEQFIYEIMCGDMDTTRFLQKALGYALTGDTSQECFFILYGSTTRNGKGTTMETTLHIMGDYGRTAQPETVAQKQNTHSGSPSEDIARLKGARFVNMSEPDKGLRLNAALVKQMTGGDTVTARFLHQNSFEFRPQYTLFINTNHLPQVHDDTIFASGRVKLIPFERHFSENEQDKGLKGFFKQPENLSGIFNWFIEGLRLMNDEGLEQPQAVIDATNEYREESSTVSLFIRECLIKVPSHNVPFKDIRISYDSWCEENGYKPFNKGNLIRELRARGLKVKNSTGNKVYIFDYAIVSNDKIPIEFSN